MLQNSLELFGPGPVPLIHKPSPRNLVSLQVDTDHVLGFGQTHETTFFFLLYILEKRFVW